MMSFCVNGIGPSGSVDRENLLIFRKLPSFRAKPCKSKLMIMNWRKFDVTSDNFQLLKTL
jgi:hypothetical protein